MGSGVESRDAELLAFDLFSAANLRLHEEGHGGPFHLARDGYDRRAPRGSEYDAADTWNSDVETAAEQSLNVRHTRWNVDELHVQPVAFERTVSYVIQTPATGGPTIE